MKLDLKLCAQFFSVWKDQSLGSNKAERAVGSYSKYTFYVCFLFPAHGKVARRKYVVILLMMRFI